jgi:hypothetical protein
MSKQTWTRTLSSNFDYITDCHSFQSDIHENWSLTRPLMLKMFEKKITLIFDKYYDEYKEIM